ncbi:hypothetical protein AVEN_233664-1 [Araneus ventricosus]|uniref:Uncharacterized protein n=1 Tax=Araneus ventricosus TaxID=182803 RepID=A0A4Y2GJC8_ARAVE|nr:hypothetical protein AVEN_233664-1 [Araneus ventricosus]
MEMVTFGGTLHRATVLDWSQIGLRNINQSLNCFHGQLSPLISILRSICGTKSRDHFEAWRRSHPFSPNLELPLCHHGPTFLSNGIRNLFVRAKKNIGCDQRPTRY